MPIPLPGPFVAASGRLEASGRSPDAPEGRFYSMQKLRCELAYIACGGPGRWGKVGAVWGNERVKRNSRSLMLRLSCHAEPTERTSAN